MTDVNQVVFSGGTINTSEDFQNIRHTVEGKEFDMLVIDKNSLLSLFDYVEKLETKVDDQKEDDETKRIRP